MITDTCLAQGGPDPPPEETTMDPRFEEITEATELQTAMSSEIPETSETYKPQTSDDTSEEMPRETSTDDQHVSPEDSAEITTGETILEQTTLENHGQNEHTEQQQQQGGQETVTSPPETEAPPGGNDEVTQEVVNTDEPQPKPTDGDDKETDAPTEQPTESPTKNSGTGTSLSTTTRLSASTTAGETTPPQPV